jgi:hypothetical protein
MMEGLVMPEGWVNETRQGVTRDIYYQTHTDSCAIACVAMAVNRRSGSRPTERAIMNAIPDATGRAVHPQGGYLPSAQNVVSANNPWFSRANNVGTYATSLAAYLAAYQLTGKYKSASSHQATVGNALWECDQHPVIAKVRATNRVGKHFIFFDGFLPNCVPTNMGQWQLVVCDPEKGLGFGTTFYLEASQGIEVGYADQSLIEWRVEEMVIVT